MSVASTVKRAAAPAARLALGGLVRARTKGWSPATRLFVLGDRGSWSVDEDADHLAATALRLGYRVAPPRWARHCGRQAVFHTSHFEALSDGWLESSHRLATAYLHGRPGTAQSPEFDAAYEALRRAPERLARIQVTHAEMRELVLSAGVEEARVFQIPIGIDVEHFPPADEAARTSARAALGLPQTAFVAGSFQKDGVGFAEGLQPKLVKGPDVLLEALERLRALVPELHVLLTGPARGYVRRGLERLGVPYRHVVARSRAELARAYHALDVYLVTSRQEGGPKAVLESLATGTPLVTTRVGQAPELVEHGRNGALVDPGDVEALVGWATRVRDDAALRAAWRAAGRAVAEANAYDRLDGRWDELLRGFVAGEDE